jgi:hypothetical protein
MNILGVDWADMIDIRHYTQGWFWKGKGLEQLYLHHHTCCSMCMQYCNAAVKNFLDNDNIQFHLGNNIKLTKLLVFIT